MILNQTTGPFQQMRTMQLLRSASATHLRSKVDIALPDVVGTRDDLEIKYRPIATDTQNGLHILPLEPNLTAGTASEKEKRGSVLGRLAKKFSLMKKPLSDQRREDDQQAPLALDDDVQAYSFDLPLPLGRLAVANPDLELDHDIQADSSLDVPLSLGWLRVANPDTTGSEKNLSFPENLPLLSKQPGTPKPLILNTPMFRFAFPAPSLPPSQCSKVISTLCNIFEEPASYRRLLKCTGRDAQVALDICQMLLDSCELSNSVGGQIIAAMQRLAAKTQLYPQRLILRSPVTLLDKDTVDAGGFGDIYKATLHNIAAGVSYLHSRGMVHGDLKPANVLVDRSGRAYLTDFGLSSVDDPLIAHWATQSSVASKGGTPRYQAPELHQTESDDDDTHDSGVIHNTPKSDVFALGCLLYEVFTGTVPFFESPNHYTVVYKVMNGKTPSRPKEGSTAWLKHGLTDEIWDVMEDCWKFDPAERTDMTSVLSRLDSMKPADHRPAPQWPVGTSMRFRNSQGVDPCQPCSSLEDLNMILQRIIHGLGNHVSAKL
ncbi:hypothetical protein DXG01_001854 [Tephrocybe rancida]|nr:hypothetical protein DXG01_001854 [Tephrocybe rancida]